MLTAQRVGLALRTRGLMAVATHDLVAVASKLFLARSQNYYITNHFICLVTVA